MTNNITGKNKRELPPLRTIAVVDLEVLAKNLSLLEGLVPASRSVPMLKADGYGHGMVRVARRLEKQASVVALGVATLEEGTQLRQAGVEKPVWVFSDGLPFKEAIGEFCLHHRLSPILHSLGDVQALARWLSRQRPSLGTQISFHFKFNTGLNRLGIPMDQLEEVHKIFRKLKKVDAEFGICTHFASSGEPRNPLTRNQVKLFKAVQARFSGYGVSYIHGANTDALLQDRQLELSKFCNTVRPGIGVYGYGGQLGVRLGLKPALQWKARVIASRILQPRQSVGYGATFKVHRKTHQTVLAVGYGDGLMRSLSNQRIRILDLSEGDRAKDVQVMGRVSMDLTSINLQTKKIGSWVTILGGDFEQGEKLSQSAGTTIYEVLTSISSRVPREYV